MSDIFQPERCGGSTFWVSSRTSFNFCFTMDILVDKSELVTEPGTIIPFSFGEQLFNTFSIIAFHISDALKTKLHFTVSILTFGSMRSIFDSRGLKLNSSLIDIGALNFITLNTSRKVW